jgi:DNA-binding NarL/FixJ family response regulator
MTSAATAHRTPHRARHQVVIVEPDSRVRRALADLVETTAGLAVRAACATVDEAEAACRERRVDAALVSLRLPGSDGGVAAVTRLAQQVPVVAFASVGSVAGRAIAAGASAFYDEDGDADALVAVLRDVIRRTSSGDSTSRR